MWTKESILMMPCNAFRASTETWTSLGGAPSVGSSLQFDLYSFIASTFVQLQGFQDVVLNAGLVAALQL